MREKLRYYISSKSRLTLSDVQTRVKMRLSEIRNWIGFTENDLRNWEKVCCSFVKWFDKNYHSNLITRKDYSNMFPVLWNRFLKETGESDKIDLTIGMKETSSNMSDNSNEAQACSNIDEALENLILNEN